MYRSFRHLCIFDRTCSCSPFDSSNEENKISPLDFSSISLFFAHYSCQPETLSKTFTSILLESPIFSRKNDKEFLDNRGKIQVISRIIRFLGMNFFINLNQTLPDITMLLIPKNRSTTMRNLLR